MTIRCFLKEAVITREALADRGNLLIAIDLGIKRIPKCTCNLSGKIASLCIVALREFHSRRIWNNVVLLLESLTLLQLEVVFKSSVTARKDRFTIRPWQSPEKGRVESKGLSLKR